MSSESIDAVFHALSDPTRRAVMSWISQRGQASATEIADQLPISRQAVVKHLAALGNAGLVAHERRGRDKFYRLTPQPLGEALSWMADVGAEWDTRLKALETLLNQSFPR